MISSFEVSNQLHLKKNLSIKSITKMKRLLEKCIVNSLYSNDVTAVNYKTIVFDEDDQVSQKCF